MTRRELAQEQVSIRHVRIDSIVPAPENDDIYNAIGRDDPAILELARSIQEYGIQEPLLVSTDHYILSGHRRRVAAIVAGLTEVPVRVHPISHEDDPEEFKRLLVTMNSQRIKSTAELLHETQIKIDPVAAHRQIINERKEKGRHLGATLSSINPRDDGRRCALTVAKGPLFRAIRRVLEQNGDFWPLSVRQVHYRLLGPDAPLIHASKSNSKYRNDKTSYRATIDVLARGRVEGRIPWEAIADDTRPVTLNDAYRNAADFFKTEFRGFLRGYGRNRLQSQSDHIEILAEKLTVQTILQDVARKHTVPLTISRGMSALVVKANLYNRYMASGKQRLRLLVVTDLDPAGETIANDFVKSFRRDFGVENIIASKVALTMEQVGMLGLEPSMDAKEKSPGYAAYVEKMGTTNAYELEALEPSQLAAILEEAIEQVLDLDAYNQELAAEENDSAQIIAVRQAEEFFRSLKAS